MQLKLIENLFGGFKVVAQMMGQLGIGRGTLKRLSLESYVNQTRESRLLQLWCETPTYFRFSVLCNIQSSFNFTWPSGIIGLYFVRGDGWFPGVDFYFTISVGVF